MQNEVMSSPPFLEWGVAAQALPGEAISGDRHVMQAFPSGALVAVIDGLGHGEEAATILSVMASLCSELGTSVRQAGDELLIELEPRAR